MPPTRASAATPRHDAALVINGSVRAARRPPARDHASWSTGASGYYLGRMSIDVRRWPIRLPCRRRSPARSSTSSQPELLDADSPPGARAAERQPRRAQPLPAGPLSPQSAHRGRPAQGRRVLREGDRRRRAILARAQRPGRRLRPAHPLRRARAGRRLGAGGVERGIGGDARRSLGRSAHVAGARARDAGLGLGRRRARVPARHSAESALPDRASLVRDVVPGADGTSRRSARPDPARAIARSGVVDHRARSWR